IAIAGGPAINEYGDIDVSHAGNYDSGARKSDAAPSLPCNGHTPDAYQFTGKRAAFFPRRQVKHRAAVHTVRSVSARQSGLHLGKNVRDASPFFCDQTGNDQLEFTSAQRFEEP